MTRVVLAVTGRLRRTPSPSKPHLVTETLSRELRGEQLRVWVDRHGPENAVVFKADKKLVGADAS